MNEHFAPAESEPGNERPAEEMGLGSLVSYTTAARPRAEPAYKFGMIVGSDVSKDGAKQFIVLPVEPHSECLDVDPHWIEPCRAQQKDFVIDRLSEQLATNTILTPQQQNRYREILEWARMR